jgi:hypothetical protein
MDGREVMPPRRSGVSSYHPYSVVIRYDTATPATTGTVSSVSTRHMIRTDTAETGRLAQSSPCRTRCIHDLADCRAHGCRWYRRHEPLLMRRKASSHLEDAVTISRRDLALAVRPSSRAGALPDGTHGRTASAGAVQEREHHAPADRRKFLRCADSRGPDRRSGDDRPHATQSRLRQGRPKPPQCTHTAGRK